MERSRTAGRLLGFIYTLQALPALRLGNRYAAHTTIYSRAHPPARFFSLPLPGSPAIDAGVASSLIATVDQRGVTCVAGSAPDMGAVEGARGWLLQQVRERAVASACLSCHSCQHCLRARQRGHVPLAQALHPQALAQAPGRVQRLHPRSPAHPAVRACTAAPLHPAHSVLPEGGCNDTASSSKCQASCQHGFLGAPSLDCTSSTWAPAWTGNCSGES